MSDVQEGTLPPPPTGDNGSGEFEVDTSGIDFGGGPLTGGGRTQRERILLIVGGVVAVLLVVFLVTKVLHKSSTPSASSGSSATSLTTPSAPGSAGNGGTGSSGALGSSGASGSSSPSATSIPAAAPYQVYTSRDPFVPVALPILSSSANLFGVTLSVTTTTVAVPVTPTAPSSPPQPTAPTSSIPSTTAPPVTQPNQSSGPPPSQTHIIELISVYTSNGQPTANLKVDGTTYAPEYEGSTFDSNFTVVTLDATTSCGTFLYADYEFQLCSGQEATV